MASSSLTAEQFWVNKSRFDTAERQYQETLSKLNKEYAKILSEDNEEGKNLISADDELPNSEQAAPPQQQQQLVAAVAAPKSSKSKKSKKSKSLKQQEADLAAAGILDMTLSSSVPVVVASVNEEQLPPSSPKPLLLEVAAGCNSCAELKTTSAKKNKKKSKAAKRAPTVEVAATSASLSSSYVPDNTTNNNNNNSTGVVVGNFSPVKILDLSLKCDSNPSQSSASASAMNVKKNVSNVKGTASNSQCTLVSEIAKAREHIKNSLEKMDGIATLAASPVSGEVLDRIAAVEKDNADLRKLVESLKTLTLESQKRIATLESQLNKSGVAAPVEAAAAAAPAAAAKKAEAEDDDGVDLFASDSDDEESAEAARIREERLAAYAAKKSKKPVLIAKSSLVLDCKPWDDETDLKVMETEIRKITADGLLWGASKFVPVAFGIQKISISCVVEDDKVSIDWLTEEIEKIEDYVQSVDVAAFNKI